MFFYSLKIEIYHILTYRHLFFINVEVVRRRTDEQTQLTILYRSVVELRNPKNKIV